MNKAVASVFQKVINACEWGFSILAFFHLLFVIYNIRSLHLSLSGGLVDALGGDNVLIEKAVDDIYFSILFVRINLILSTIFMGIVILIKLIRPRDGK